MVYFAEGYCYTVDPGALSSPEEHFAGLVVVEHRMDSYMYSMLATPPEPVLLRPGVGQAANCTVRHPGTPVALLAVMVQVHHMVALDLRLVLMVATVRLQWHSLATSEVQQ